MTTHAAIRSQLQRTRTRRSSGARLVDLPGAYEGPEELPGPMPDDARAALEALGLLSTPCEPRIVSTVGMVDPGVDTRCKSPPEGAACGGGQQT